MSGLLGGLKRGTLAAWGLVLLGILLAPPAQGQDRSIVIEDFDAAIGVSESALVEVTETIRLRFTGEWNGIHRRIPIRYVDARGENYGLRLNLLGVTDEAGKRLEVSRSGQRQEDDLKIWVPGAANAVRTVVIRYTVGRALKFFDDHDELYWNVTGDQWPYPIGTARARISLPRAVENIRVNAFTGGYRSTERSVAITVDGQKHGPENAFTAAGESAPPPEGGGHDVEVLATRPLGIREGLTVAVAWNPGQVRRPTALETRLAWFRDNAGALMLSGLVALIPLATFGWMFRHWWAVGRDPRPGPVVVQYAPPAGLGPAEVGTLIDNSPDNRDLMALLVDCAVKGIIRIRETAPAGWFQTPKYAFDLLVPSEDWKDLSPAAAALLGGMFTMTSGEWAGMPGVVCSVTSDELGNRFYTHLPAIKGAIFGSLVKEGHYAERPDHVLTHYLIAAPVAGVAVAGILVGLNRLAWQLPSEGVIPQAILCGVLTAVILGGFAVIMPARTAKGGEARTAILGFQEYLSRVDAHRLATLPMTPELFERFLPYAMALGVEGRWAKAFEGICKEPPQWYAGTGPVGHFQPYGLTQSLGQMGQVTSQAMTSGPRSSEGS
ncbi:MAG: DUF2207 domain-containing protein, partial [Planctomycetia bacterium]